MKKYFLSILILLFIKSGIAQVLRDHRQPVPLVQADTVKKKITVKKPPGANNGIPTPTEEVSTGDIIPPFDEMVVYRIQLKITTASGQGSGTDDGVYAQLNGNDQRFFLSRGIENFETGKTVVYDILSEYIGQVKNIEFLRIGKNGQDALCISKVELLLNNNPEPVFEKSWDIVRGTCIDKTYFPELEIPITELRMHHNWKLTKLNYDMLKKPAMISSAFLARLVEASIGNAMQLTNLRWGSTGGINTIWGDAVEIKRVNDNTMHIDLDMQRQALGPNNEVDIDFDLAFYCTDGVIWYELERVEVSGDGSHGEGVPLVKKALKTYPVGKIFPTIERTLLARLYQTNTRPISEQGYAISRCNSVHVTNNGDILIQ